ncbi:MAG: TIGR01777 family oxidoreductase [Acidimicrobiales bacterium]
MDVVISGASGLIGTALAARLRERGHTPIPLVRREVREGERAIRWDPDGGTIDHGSLEGVDAVVHLAGENIGARRWTDEQKAKISNSRTRGTTLLAEALVGLDQRPEVFISASAVGYYGDRGDEVLTETSGPGDDFIAEVCVKWEASSQLAAAAGIRTVNTRTGVVLATEEGALARQLLPFKLGVGGRLGSGRQWQSWISLADEVGAICHLLEADVEGPVNLTAPNPVTNNEFTKTLGRVLRRPTLVPIPIFAPALLYGRELVETLLLVSQRAVPSVLEASGYEFTHAQLEPALRDILGRPAS